MSYETYAKIRDAAGLSDYKVSKLSGVSSATISEWGKGKYTPKDDKRKRIAEALGITLAQLDGDEPVQGEDVQNNVHAGRYYIDDETARLAGEMFADPDMRALFQMKRTMRPEVFRAHMDMMKKLYKLEHPDD